MGGDPQYMWGQARSGQPAGRIGHWRSARAGAPLFAGTGAGAAPVPNPASRLAGSGLPPHILGVTPHIMGGMFIYSLYFPYYGAIFPRTCPTIPGTCYFWKKKAPARKPAHSRPNLGQKSIFPKVDFWSNDPSQIEATCLLTPPASSI